MKEQWKQVPGYEGIYEASNTGKIRTCEGKTTYTDFHGARVWQSRELKGRGNNPITGKRVNLCKDRVCKEYLFCRVVAATWLGLDMEEKYVAGKTPTVNHKDGNRFNNAIDNLEIMSLKDNMRHAFDTGLQKNMKSIALVNVKTLQKTKYKSYSEAGRAIGRSGAYVSNCIIKKKTYVYDCSGEQFKIIYKVPTITQDNHFRKIDKQIDRSGIVIKDSNGQQLSFKTMLDCSHFLQRSPGYVSNSKNKGKTSITHANGNTYRIIEARMVNKQ